MADQIRVTDDRTAAPSHGASPSPRTGVDATARPGAGGLVVPDDPEAARAEIEVTRARMSETIDEIEDVLLRKKERIQERLDVLSPVRARPLPAVGVALGAGLLLGLLTGDDDRDEPRARRRYPAGVPDDVDQRLRELEERASTWEDRTRRLLHIAQEQEAEIEQLRRSRDPGPDHRAEADAAGDSSLDRLRDRVVAGIAGYVGTAVRDLVRERIGGRP